MTNALMGRRVLVTRPAAQADGLRAMIAAEGGVPVLFPLLEIVPAENLGPLDAAAARLEEFSLAVFISPNAVESALPRLLAGRAAWPVGVRPAAVGPGTASLLERMGVSGALLPQARFDSEALLALEPMQAGYVCGQRVLILRGNGGRELLADTLRERGATVECVTCYGRRAPSDPSALVSLLRNNGLDAVIISSSESLRNMMDLLDTDASERLRALPVFVPHPRIAEEAARLGLRHVTLTRPADSGLVEGLCTYPWLHHERQR